MKKLYKGLSPVMSIEPEDMMEYKSEFTIDDFNEVCRELDKERRPHGPVIIGSEEQITAYYEKDFWPAMERAAIAYLNNKER